MTNLKDLIEKISDDIPLNTFTIEDKDPYVILGKINEVLASLEQIQATINASDSKANEALNKAIESLRASLDAINASTQAVDSANTALNTANTALDTANTSLDTSNTALANSDMAITDSSDAIIKANEAINTANEALSKVIEATGTTIIDYSGNKLKEAKFLGSDTISVDLSETDPQTFTFKVDQSVINSINEKASSEYLAQELQKKANTSYVDQVVSGKADKAQVTSISERTDAVETSVETINNTLPNKANVNYVDDALSFKANTQYVNTELAKKLNISDTSTITDIDSVGDRYIRFKKRTGQDYGMQVCWGEFGGSGTPDSSNKGQGFEKPFADTGYAVLITPITTDDGWVTFRSIACIERQTTYFRRGHMNKGFNDFYLCIGKWR